MDKVTYEGVKSHILADNDEDYGLGDLIGSEVWHDMSPQQKAGITRILRQRERDEYELELRSCKG